MYDWYDIISRYIATTQLESVSFHRPWSLFFRGAFTYHRLVCCIFFPLQWSRLDPETRGIWVTISIVRPLWCNTLEISTLRALWIGLVTVTRETQTAMVSALVSYISFHLYPFLGKAVSRNAGSILKYECALHVSLCHWLHCNERLGRCFVVLWLFVIFPLKTRRNLWRCKLGRMLISTALKG